MKSSFEDSKTRWSGRGMARRLELVDGWQLHVDKHALRAAFEGTDEHVVREWLVRGTDDGSLIRQEVASMLPAVLLDVPEDACVLDMCASPGSKTTQVLEKLGPRGVVVANDFSPLRSYTLVRRTASLGVRAAAMVVTCHGAQKMPRPPRIAPRLTRWRASWAARLPRGRTTPRKRWGRTTSGHWALGWTHWTWARWWPR